MYETNVRSLRSLNRPDEAIEIANQAIQLGESYLKDSPDAELTIAVALLRSTRMVLIYERRSPEEFLEELPACYQSLNDSFEVGGSKRQMHIRQNYIAIFRGCEAVSLAKLARWESAIEKCKSVLEIKRQNRSTQSIRYFDAAMTMAKISSHWRTNKEKLDTEFDVTTQLALDWLSLAVTENGFNDLKRLKSITEFAELQSLERYRNIVRQIKE